MEKPIEVMKQSLELSETILESLYYIQKQLNEGNGNQTIFLFEDVLVAYTTITRTTTPVLKELNNENGFSLQTELSKTADLVVTAYEENNYAKAQEVLQFSFIPQLKKLKEELEKTFSPYLVS